jgi:sugar O-acyltransferase (sialic acid O-acetyltransferase NeuD family)
MVPAVRKVVILGTGGNAVDILDTVRDLNEAPGRAALECLGFLDDDPARAGTTLHGVPVLGPLSLARTLPEAWFVNGIGSPGNFWKKEAIIASAGVRHERFLTLVHPAASVSRMARLGPGTVVFQNATVTSNVIIGNHVVILPNSVISHDDRIGDYTCVAGGVCISGGVTVGKTCYLGTRSCLNGNIKVGDYCLVGMGSVVLRDVPENSVVVGQPARFLRPTRPVND